MFKKISLPGLLLFAALTFASSPTQSLAASDCGGEGGNHCSMKEKCYGFWIFKWGCNTTYEYWVGR